MPGNALAYAAPHAWANGCSLAICQPKKRLVAEFAARPTLHFDFGIDPAGLLAVTSDSISSTTVCSVSPHASFDQPDAAGVGHRLWRRAGATDIRERNRPLFALFLQLRVQLRYAINNTRHFINCVFPVLGRCAVRGNPVRHDKRLHFSFMPEHDLIAGGFADQYVRGVNTPLLQNVGSASPSQHSSQTEQVT